MYIPYVCCSVMDKCLEEHCFYMTYLMWLLLVMVPVLVSSVLVVYIEVSLLIVYFIL